MNLNLWLIPVLPLVGAAINGLFGRRFSNKLVSAIALASTGLSFAYTLFVTARFFSLPADRIPHIEHYATWIRTGAFEVPFAAQLDQLSLVMLLVVTGVGFLIHVYSVGYMAHEGGYYRFFSYLNLFMFFMLVLVLANNYLLMFVGWEGVGLASYLLIGFYFTKDSAASAGKKAFITNRVGDFGFLIALFLLVKHFGTLEYGRVFEQVSGMPVEASAGLLTAIAILMMVGAAGKSAQIPLYVWLPDAMEGPTPVSALIHAATMVTAGVYMVARSNPIFFRSPEALALVAIIGAITAIFAASIGFTQNDIKRVLAYSTISQLGYMFLACGVAAFSAGIFHLMTHAFFKALLFLSAGSVIHALGGEQDMRNMGGLRTKIPRTFWVMTAGVLAIAGTPGLSGFFSKDQILWKAWASPHGGKLLWLIAVFTAFMTSFYMFRLWFMTFFNEHRGAKSDKREEPVHGGPADHRAAHANPHGHGHGSHGIHESPWVMIAPLVILAVLSVVGGYVGVPHALGGHNQFDQFLAPVFKFSAEAMPAGEHPASPAEGAAQHAAAAHEDEILMERLFTGISIGVAALGFLLAWLLYVKRRDLPGRITEALGGLYTAVRNKYYVDELYNAAIIQPIIQGSSRWLWRGIDTNVIDRTIDNGAGGAQGISDAVRRMQSGNIRSYAGWVALGAACIVAYMIWMGVK